MCVLSENLYFYLNFVKSSKTTGKSITDQKLDYINLTPPPPPSKYFNISNPIALYLTMDLKG